MNKTVCAMLALATASCAMAGNPTSTASYNGFTVTMTLCSAIKHVGQWDVAPEGPTTAFPFKGTERNVMGVLTFNPGGNRDIKFKAVIYKNGAHEEYREVDLMNGFKTGMFAFTLRPGTYEIQMVNAWNGNDYVWMKNTFVVGPDTVGDRASGNIASGSGKLMVCKSVDDNWSCVGQADTWKANQPFNLYVKMPVAAGVVMTKWVIHKQNPNGTDGAFVDEQIQNINNEKSTKWATEDGFRLPAGKYTIYSIAAAEAQATEHTGNLKNFFAKTTLTIQ